MKTIGKKSGQKNVRQKNEDDLEVIHFSVSHFSVRSFGPPQKEEKRRGET